MGASFLADGLRVTLRDRERRFTLAVDGLEVRAGEAIGLTGASGTGKTLLLELLGLLKRPDAGGRYLVRNSGTETDLTRLWVEAGSGGAVSAARGGLFGFVPQSGGLLPFLSVQDNIALSQKICRRVDGDFVRLLLDRLGLTPLARMLPQRLSIGQRQRVSIARALAHRPRFVIADEPTASLDPANAAGAMALLLEVVQDSGSALIISSHDVDLLDAFALTRYRLEPSASANGSDVVSRLVRTEAGA